MTIGKLWLAILFFNAREILNDCVPFLLHASKSLLKTNTLKYFSQLGKMECLIKDKSS